MYCSAACDWPGGSAMPYLHITQCSRLIIIKCTKVQGTYLFIICFRNMKLLVDCSYLLLYKELVDTVPVTPVNFGA